MIIVSQVREVMIKEKLMIEIAEKYFERESVKAIRQRGSGPDFLLDGRAIEVKGSNAKFSPAIAQLLDYAFKYSGLTVILPIDLLSNPTNLLNFHLLCCLARRTIDTILVGKENEFYYLKKFPYGRIILSDVINAVAKEERKLEEWEKSETMEFLQNLKAHLEKAFLKIIKTKSDMILPTSAVPAIQIQSVVWMAATSATVYVQNVGSGRVIIDCAYIDEVLQDLAGTPLDEGETVDLTVTGTFANGQEVRIKVVCSDGSFTEGTYTVEGL